MPIKYSIVSSPEYTERNHAVACFAELARDASMTDYTYPSPGERTNTTGTVGGQLAILCDAWSYMVWCIAASLLCAAVQSSVISSCSHPRQ